jgi:hypothetical protein
MVICFPLRYGTFNQIPHSIFQLDPGSKFLEYIIPWFLVTYNLLTFWLAGKTEQNSVYLDQTTV